MNKLGAKRLPAAVAAVVATVVIGSTVAISESGPAYASGPVTVSISSTPASVADGQAISYSVIVTNSGSSQASGLTLSVTMSGVGPGQMSALAATTSTGSCTYASPTETCTAAAVGPGQDWNVTLIGAVTTGAGTTVSATASVSGTEASSAFGNSATTTTTVSPTLPAGFAQTKLAGGLAKPIALAFAPNGDIYIAEQGGTILIYRKGAILPTPVITLNVFEHGETGLLGLALDPDFATNGYMYVSYTLPVTNSSGTVVAYSQLSRFTVVNGVASPASEDVFYRGNQTQNEDGTGGSYDHAGADLKVGPDGKLWWSVGDNVPAISNGQALNNIYGKVLRFNLDGSVPSDNPFVDVPGAVPYIYAYGLRNPWRFTFLPTGQAMTEDTGSNYWEDLDTLGPGDNFGWPVKEGNCGSCGYANPAYSYGHFPTDGAASAISAYSGSTFPQAYDHVVFFGDYNRDDIEAVSFDPTFKTAVSDTVFDQAAGTIADLVEGPDGNLYFVSIFEGTVSEISAPGPFPPTASASATPDAGNAPLAVQFSSAGSSDPYGKTLSYSWSFGDGSAPATTADPTHTYTVGGTYTATLTVSNGTQNAVATTKVVVGPSPPTASITAPSAYDAGDTVSFSGTASDPVDGVLPASAYTWQVDYHVNGVVQPSYYAEVANPFYGPVSGVTSGSFTVPTDPSQVPGSFYRITLTVTDSSGLQTVVTHDLTPNLTSWSAGANVAGAGYFVDGAWETGTYSTLDVVGVVHVLTGMTSAQTIGGTRYRFAGWADGSALGDTITAGSGPGTYTADYDTVQTTMPSPWQSAEIGSPITAGTADYNSGDQTFYVDGAGADEFGANDQSHYVYQTVTGDVTIVARVRYQTAASSWSKAGVMIRQSTTAGAPFVDALVAPDVSPTTPNANGVGCDPDGCLAPLPPVNPAMGYGARMQYTGSHSATPASYPVGFSEPDKWLKLQKSGNTFTSWLSSDGVNWTQIGIATETMTGPVTVGLFDTSHNIGQDSTAAFDNVQVSVVSPPPPPGPLPSPWTDTDVGSPAIAGSAGYTSTGGVFTVNGAGADIWGTSDQFHYVYQPVSTSGTIVARVTSQTNTSSNAKAGVMFKQSTAAGSPYFMIAAGPAGNIKVQYDFNNSYGEGTYSFPNAWMKLMWSGAAFTAYLSSDGVTWTQVLSKAYALTSPATVGLFVCSHNASALGTATFDNVNVASP
jgi:glucose/arabinose dehydrogenase/PKD repeat protein